MWGYLRPCSIVEKVMQEKARDFLEGVVHICEDCSRMHKSAEIKETIAGKYKSYIPEITTRFGMSMALCERVASNTGNLHGLKAEEDAL